MECMQIKLLCVFFYRILELNLLKAILRIKLDQYARSVRANVLNIQIVVCGCTQYSKGLTTSTLAWLLSYWLCSSRLVSEKISGRYHVNNMQ